MFYTALLLLPAVAYAQISIRVEAGLTAPDSLDSVEFHGTDKEAISDTERRTWRITHEDLRDAVLILTYGRPKEVFVKKTKTLDDLYAKHGWPEVRRILSPYNVTILGVKSEPGVIVESSKYVHSGWIRKNSLQGLVATNVSSTWKSTGELTVGGKITYRFVLGTGRSTTWLNFIGAWGNNTKSNSYKIESECGFNLELQPGETTFYTLTATRITMEFQISFRATLEGSAVSNYPEQYKGHHFRADDINSLLSKVGKPLHVDSSVVVKIEFYADSNYVLSS